MNTNPTPTTRRQFLTSSSKQGAALAAGIIAGSSLASNTQGNSAQAADKKRKQRGNKKRKGQGKQMNAQIIGAPDQRLIDPSAIDARLEASSQNQIDASQSRDKLEGSLSKFSPLQQSLMDCLGGPWPAPPELNEKIRATTQRDGYKIISSTFEAEPVDPIPALLMIPDGVTADNPAPAVSIWHQHAGQYHLGKSEPAGLAGKPMHHTGVALVKEGYVVLCVDSLCFEERQHPRMKNRHFEEHAFLRYVMSGKSLAWKNILDMRRAIDYLCSRPEVQAGNIGCYGHSMGSTHTWLVGPWDARLKCSVGNCCLPTYEAIQKHDLLHCFPNFVPGWQQHGDTPDIAGLIAPRALHLNFGAHDSGSPIAEVRVGVKRIEEMYAEKNASEQFSYFIQDDVGHVLSEPMWEQTRDVFAKHLKTNV